MKKLMVVAVAGVVALALCGDASAVLYRDIDAIGIELDASGAASYSGDFDIVTGDGDVNIGIGWPYNLFPEYYSDEAGFDPSGESVVGATAYFYLQGTLDLQQEEVVVEIADLTEGPVVIDYLWNNTIEIADLQLIVDLQDDGRVGYTVTAVSGDVQFDYARLDADARPTGAQGVPDGGATIALLGMAMAGIGLLRRR